MAAKKVIPFDRGPYLVTAVLCEKVLEEKDGVKSAIRIIDRVVHSIVSPNPPEDMQPFDYELKLLIKIKCGEARGLYPVKVRLIKPSGESPTPLEQNILLEGEEDGGVDIVGNLRMKFDQTGIYWFEVYISNELYTKIPLRVVYIPQIMQIRGAGEGRPPSPE